MMNGSKPGLGIRSPGITLVVTALTTLYVCICGLATLAPNPVSLLLAATLILATLMASSRLLDARHPAVPYVGVLGVITVYAACIVGIRNHRVNYYPYLAAKEGRDYSGITPAAKALAHADGGIITFKDGASLVVEESVGMRLDGVTYCVAPILSADAVANQGADMTATQTIAAAPAPAAAPPPPATPEVQFFAIGEDCCDARGGFRCDDAAVQSTLGGLVWHEPVEGSLPSRIFAAESQRPEYMKSVQAAMVLSGRRSAIRPVLMRWVANPYRLLVFYLTRGLLTWICSSVIFGLICACTWFAIDFHFDRLLRGSMRDALTGRDDLRPPPGTNPGASPGTGNFGGSGFGGFGFGTFGFGGSPRPAPGGAYRNPPGGPPGAPAATRGRAPV